MSETALNISDASRRGTSIRQHLTTAFRHTIVYGFGQVFGKAISFLLIPFYTHYLSPADYGVLELLNLTTLVLSVVAALGLSTAVVNYYFKVEDPTQKKQAISTAMLYSVVVGGILLALGFVGAGPVSKFLLGTRAPGLFRLAMTAFFFTFCSDIASSYLRIRQRSILYTVLNQAFLYLSVGANIYLIAFRRMGVAGALWGTVIASSVMGSVLVTVLVRDVGIQFSYTQLFEMLKFGFPLLWSWVAAYVLNYSDRFFLQRFSSLSEVGLYSVAYKFGFILALGLVQPFQLMWQVQAFDVARHDNAQATYARIFSLYTGALLGVWLIVCMFIPEVFRAMVDRRFQSAYALVPLIGLAYVAQGVSCFFETGLLVQGRNKTLGYVSVICTSICLLLNYLCIRMWTIWGACIATLLSFVLSAVMMYSCSQKHNKVPYRIRSSFVLFAGSVALVIAGWELIPGPLWLIVASKLVLVGTFVFLISVMGIVTRSEFRQLRDTVVGWITGRLLGSTGAA
jgi:O-antigen/teichoic acid export membrane protein